MVRPNRNNSSESSNSSKASVDHEEKEFTGEDMKETLNKEAGQDDNTGSPLSSVMGVKLDPNQMVILSGD